MASSSAAAAASGEHWTAHYRRRLGIGSSPVVLYRPDPPKHGELKIIFVVLPCSFVGAGANVRTVAAIALDSSFDLFGLTFGILKYESQMGVQLYALRAAGNLARALKEKGIHEGPVVYHSALLEVTACLHERCEGDAELAMRRLTPRDLEEVDGKCMVFVGRDPDALVDWIDRQGVPELKGLIETMKNGGGVCTSSSAKVSSDDGCSAGEHWSAQYRRRLGIGNSPVLSFPNRYKHGEFKILFFVSPVVDEETGKNVKDMGRFCAFAVNHSVDFFGFAMGEVKFRNKLGMELYALRAAGVLAKALRYGGFHNGPVVYESNLKLMTTCFDEHCNDELEVVLREAMPEDLEDVDERCRIQVGDPDTLFKVMPEEVRPQVMLLKKLKDVAGNSHGVGSTQFGSHGQHWLTKYRQHLGIGDSPVVGYNKDPPKQGGVKILFVAVRDDAKDWESTPPWTIGCMALNSSMKPIGITGGSIKFTNEMGMQLYALRAAGNLVKKLKEKGVIDGPVVYQSGDPEVTAFLDEYQGEPETVMPDDLESVDKKFLNIVGTKPKKLLNWLDRLGTPALKALIEGMKKGAGVR